MESWDRLKPEYSYEYIQTEDVLQHTSKLPFIYTKPHLVPLKTKFKASNTKQVPGWFAERTRKTEQNQLALTGDKPATVSNRQEMFKSPRYPHARLPKVEELPKTIKRIKQKHHFVSIQGVLHELDSDFTDTISSPKSPALSIFSNPCSPPSSKFDRRTESEGSIESLQTIKITVDLKKASNAIPRKSRLQNQMQNAFSQTSNQKLVQPSKSEPNLATSKFEKVSKVELFPSIEISPYLLELYMKYPLLKLDELYFRSKVNNSIASVLPEIPEETKETLIMDLLRAIPMSKTSIEKLETNQKDKLFDGYMNGLMTGKLKTKEDAAKYVKSRLRKDGLYTVQSSSRESEDSGEFETLQNYLKRNNIESNSIKSTASQGRSAFPQDLSLHSRENPEDSLTLQEFNSHLMSDQAMNTENSPVNSDRAESDPIVDSKQVSEEDKELLKSTEQDPTDLEPIVDSIQISERDSDPIVPYSEHLLEESSSKEIFRENSMIIEEKLSDEAIQNMLEYPKDLPTSEPIICKACCEPENKNLKENEVHEVIQLEVETPSSRSYQIREENSYIESKAIEVIKLKTKEDPLVYKTVVDDQQLNSGIQYTTMLQPIQEPNITPSDLKPSHKSNKPSKSISKPKPSKTSSVISKANSLKSLSKRTKKPNRIKVVPQPSKVHIDLNQDLLGPTSQPDRSNTENSIAVVISDSSTFNSTEYQDYFNKIKRMFSLALIELTSHISIIEAFREVFNINKRSNSLLNSKKLSSLSNIGLLGVPTHLNLNYLHQDSPQCDLTRQSSRGSNREYIACILSRGHSRTNSKNLENEDFPKIPFTRAVSNFELLNKSMSKLIIPKDSKGLQQVYSWTDSDNVSQTESDNREESVSVITTRSLKSVSPSPYNEKRYKIDLKNTLQNQKFLKKPTPEVDQPIEDLIQEPSSPEKSNPIECNPVVNSETQSFLEDLDINTKLRNMFKNKHLHKGFVFTPQVRYEEHIKQDLEDVDDLNQIDLHNYQIDEAVLDSIALKNRFYQASKYMPSFEKLSKKQNKILRITVPDSPLPEQSVKNYINQIEKKKKREKVTAERKHNPAVLISNYHSHNFSSKKNIRKPTSVKNLKLTIDRNPGGQYDELVLNEWRDSIDRFRTTQNQLYNSKSCRNWNEMKNSGVNNFIVDNLEVLRNTR